MATTTLIISHKAVGDRNWRSIVCFDTRNTFTLVVICPGLRGHRWEPRTLCNVSSLEGPLVAPHLLPGVLKIDFLSCRHQEARG